MGPVDEEDEGLKCCLPVGKVVDEEDAVATEVAGEPIDPGDDIPTDAKPVPDRDPVTLEVEG